MLKEEAISVYSVNATVYKDITPTGKDKYIIKLNNNTADAVGRIQKCHDYDQRLPLSFILIKGTRVFKNDYEYITFAMYPRDSSSSYLITCRCNHQNLPQEDALKLIDKGMSEAISKINS